LETRLKVAAPQRLVILMLR